MMSNKWQWKKIDKWLKTFLFILLIFFYASKKYHFDVFVVYVNVYCYMLIIWYKKWRANKNIFMISISILNSKSQI